MYTIHKALGDGQVAPPDEKGEKSPNPDSPRGRGGRWGRGFEFWGKRVGWEGRDKDKILIHYGAEYAHIHVYVLKHAGWCIHWHRIICSWCHLNSDMTVGERSKFPFCDHKQTTKDDKRRWLSLCDPDLSVGSSRGYVWEVIYAGWG